MSDPVAAALIAFVAAILGGILQAAFARLSERSKFEREAKWTLYTNYFVTLGELSFSEPATARHNAALSTMAQIRGRIGIMGSPEVIAAVGDVFRFADLKDLDAQDAMTAALEAMRKDVGKTPSASDRDALRQLMFGSRDKE